MNIIKSLLVLIFLLSLLAVLVVLFVRYMRKHPKVIRELVIIMITASLFLGAVFFFGDYVYPFERVLLPELIEELEVLEGYENNVKWRHWYGVYKGCPWFNPNGGKKQLGYDWPQLEIDKYSYVITYGRKIESLSYNVWDKVSYPQSSGAKEGHIVWDDEYISNKVYIYRIPRIKIDVDLETWHKKDKYGVI